MIASAIDKILSLAKPAVVQIGDEMYGVDKLTRLDTERHAEPLHVRTLSSMVLYIREFNDMRKDLPLLVQVVSPTKVQLVTALDKDRKRECLMVAEAELPIIPFHEFIDNEKMLIAVQSMFVEDAETDRALVLKFAGTVTSGSVKEYGDDGVTQKATIQNGVASKATAIVPSPCKLTPFRTFLEVEQPTSEFIFRMKEGRDNTVLSALFEADGGAWKNEAVDNIRCYLEKALEGTGVIVIS